MPNWCYYEMAVAGQKEQCKKWVERMKSYDEPNHFWRIAEVRVYDEFDANGEHCMMISGECAWSLQSCCRAGGYSEIDLFAENTRELHLKMEAYSSEPGMCFQEHYIYKYGKCIVDECEDYTELYWDRGEFPDFADFKRAYEIEDNITEDDFDEDGYCRNGGFPDWEFDI